ncbi:MAG: ACP S-malonyltransferase [Pirellulaceae bacterium]|nr:ACP S-malonyltransferase [Pirellulaceae bacterium]
MSKTAFLFPGQGAQTVGMGRQVAAQLPRAGELFSRANEVLGYDLSAVCFDGPAEKLNSTVHSQPGLFVASLAALEQLSADRPEAANECAMAAGLSLGEYTAVVFAGVMDFETGLRVVQARGEAMQAAADAVDSGMVSILGLEPDRIAELCEQVRADGEVLRTANLLCPGNTVVSGHSTACQRVAEAADAAGAMKTIPLAVAGAFHTPLMESAVARLTAALADADLKPPRIPVVSNVDAQAHTDPDEIRELLIQQVVSPVRWEDSMRAMLSAGVDQFVEIGPGRVLRGLLRRVDRRISCENVGC